MGEREITGQCLCGEVRYEGALASSDMGLCHCGMCRRWSGGLPFATIGAKVVLRAQESLRWRESSPWGERGFCGACGTPMFWRTRDGGGPWMVSVGTLDDTQGLTIKEHIYINEKAGFYDFADDAPRLTGVDFIVRTFTALQKVHGKEFLAGALPQLNATFDAETVAEVRRRLAENGAMAADD